MENGFITDESEQTGQTFKNLSIKAGEIQGVEFNACHFINCAFNETIFRGCYFVDCLFQGSDLSLMQVPKSIIHDTRFVSCKVIGVNWTLADWKRKSLLKKKRLDFTECVLNYSIFMGLNLEQAVVFKCMAREVNFEETNLTRADCRYTDFSASKFARTNLSEADFTHAQNYAISVKENTLHKTKFSLPEAMSLLYGLDIELVED